MLQLRKSTGFNNEKVHNFYKKEPRKSAENHIGPHEKIKMLNIGP